MLLLLKLKGVKLNICHGLMIPYGHSDNMLDKLRGGGKNKLQNPYSHFRRPLEMLNINSSFLNCEDFLKMFNAKIVGLHSTILNLQVVPSSDLAMPCSTEWREFHQITLPALVDIIVHLKPSSSKAPTVLVKVSNDIFVSLDNGENAILILLDLSADFNKPLGTLVRLRIIYKILTLVFKALHNLPLMYFSSMVAFYTPSRSLRSERQHLLCAIRTKYKHRVGGSSGCAGCKGVNHCLSYGECLMAPECFKPRAGLGRV
ncbi:hypothetical protein H4Q32_008827 [Labeo rohita]|uniref:Uncharacterized protein n=1 Tax=Labeo rohita TaxID=84645 RepID=A0ABQ8M3L2_LABRO|nr:hypothetical protein H4Q32_008827 [Labeo rohita]